MYDSWGKLLDISGTLASTIGLINPYRYRGYRYDTETGLYYLQSRYYDPVMGRFLNADGLVNNGHEFTGYNMFAYCLNNPVNMADEGGYCPYWNGFSDFFVDQWESIKTAFCHPVGSYIGYVSDPWNWFPAARLMRDQALEVSGIWQSAISGDVNGLAHAFGQRAGMATEVLVIAGVSKGVKSASNSQSRGSTAKKQPSNLREQLALEQVKSNPQGKKLPVKMNDPRWPASKGWVKMQQIVPTSQGNINIHYVFNQILKIFDDFKIK